MGYRKQRKCETLEDKASQMRLYVLRAEPQSVSSAVGSPIEIESAHLTTSCRGGDGIVPDVWVCCETTEACLAPCY